MLFLLCGCGAQGKQAQPGQTVTVDARFQKQLTAIPTVPEYRCGAWASNNVPGADSTITIYAKLTKDVAGVAGIPAQATAHFKRRDVTLDEKPVTDSNGYVAFTLPLQGRQPAMVPATVDVTFTVNNGARPVQCSAFFTPQ